MHVKKPVFEQFLRETTRFGRPLPARDVPPIQDAIVASLDSFPDLLVEKVRYLPQGDVLLDISAKWLGLDAQADDIVRMLRQGWNDHILTARAAKFHAVATDTAVVLVFAAAYGEAGYLTGRIKITI